MSIGENIKKRRFELRMSQQELADAMGYKTRSTIAKIESGENDVSQKKLQKFAAVLDTTVEALIWDYTAKAEPQITEHDFDNINRNKNVAVILAGGKYSENQRNIPSQFVSVNGKPIVMYSMDAYQAHPSIDDIYVVCLKGWEHIVKAYANQYGVTKLKGLIPAGNSGTESLKNALERIKDIYAPDDFVFIQEATRPLVSVETISKLMQTCVEKGSATICHSMQEYVQFHMRNGNARYVDRNSMIALQSPEVHRLSLIQEVFQKAEELQHPLTETCCTMLLYNLGYEINFVESSVNNIKVIREEEIAAFRAFIRE